MAEIRINIDGQEIVTHEGYTIQAIAAQHGIEIPTLCQDDKLKSYGSCGICVVEVEGNPRLVRSCSTLALDGMVVRTDTPRVRESRKTTLELFISNHEGDCKAPCTLGCPDQVDIQGYVGLTANGQFDEALRLIKQDLPLPASIGRVCPHPCQTACRRAIKDDAIEIAWVKRFVADRDLEKEIPYMPTIMPDTGKKVAIVGGGPSGLSAAYFLRQKGHDVTIFEANEQFGGMLYYGIPIYRLPKDVLEKEINIIRMMGVTMHSGVRLGRDIQLAYLRANYDAVYVAVGAWQSSFMGIPGEELQGVYGGIEFLGNFVRNIPTYTGKTIAVIGGGNTAMDAARTSIRLGAEKVYVLYRRTKEDMPATDVEIHEAEEEGVDFRFLLNPVEILGEEGKVKQIRLQHMQAFPPEKEGGRNRVEPIEDQFTTLDVDSVLVSVGQQTVLDGLDELERSNRGLISVGRNTYQTNLPGVFAGGDVIDNRNKIAIQAIADGKNAATAMDSYLRGELKPVHRPFYVIRKDMTLKDLPEVEHQPSGFMEHLDPEIRKHNFDEVVAGFTPENVVYDTNRCFECGCMDYSECDLYRHANNYDVRPERFEGAKSILPIEDDHPYILRDPNKCILCGMCVRVCDEVMDLQALGLVERGFDTNVAPPLKSAFKDSTCISCGQCVDLCPVGALQEKRPIHKQVPLRGQHTDTACVGCSVGCDLTVETKSSMLLRTLPIQEDPTSAGLLCVKGRFEHERFLPENRQLKTWVRKDGALQEVPYEEAVLQVARKAQSLQLLNGQNSIAVAISDQHTLEEIFMAKKLAKDVLKTDKVYSLGYRPSGLTDVFGLDASTSTFEELEGTQFILAVGEDLLDSHAIAALKIKKAMEKGVKLFSLSTKANKLEDWAAQSYRWDQSLNLLKGICKALLEKADPGKFEGFEGFAEAMENIEVSDSARTIAEAYAGAKKAMIVYDQAILSREAEQLLAAMAALSGHVGSPRSGIIQLKKGVNSQGIVDLGFGADAEELLQAIDNGEIKGLISIGEGVDSSIAEKLDFLSLLTAENREEDPYADVIIPISVLTETQGFVTSTERRVHAVRQALKPVNGKETIEILKDVMHTFGSHVERIDRQAILEGLHADYSAYRGIHREEESFFAPNGQIRQLYLGGQFDTASGKAQLVVPE